MRRAPLCAVLIGATLSLTARADLASVSNPPLCRVTATLTDLIDETAQARWRLVNPGTLRTEHLPIVGVAQGGPLKRLFPLALLVLAPNLAAGIVATSSTAPPLCRVQVSSAPSRLPGFYGVTIELRPECPVDAVADVRLESYIGGRYPRTGFFRVTRSHPLKRSGVPWYWRVGWRSASGQVFPLTLPNTRTP